MYQIDGRSEACLQWPDYLDPETSSSNAQVNVREAFLYNRGSCRQIALRQVCVVNDW